MEDENVREFVTAILNGEEFGGTPSQPHPPLAGGSDASQTLPVGRKSRRRSQVKIVFPGIMIMIACLLIIVTPFIVKFIDVFI